MNINIFYPHSILYCPSNIYFKRKLNIPKLNQCLHLTFSIYNSQINWENINFFFSFFEFKFKFYFKKFIGKKKITFAVMNRIFTIPTFIFTYLFAWVNPLQKMILNIQKSCKNKNVNMSGAIKSEIPKFHMLLHLVVARWI